MTPMSKMLFRKLKLSLRLLWMHWHGTSRMKKWIVALVAITLAGLLLQLALSIRGTSPTWLFRLDLASNATTTTPTLPNLEITSPHTPRPPQAAGKNVSSTTDGLTGRKKATSGPQGGPHTHRPYRFLLNEPHACSGSPELVIVVITIARRARDRQAVRDTWGSVCNDSSRRLNVSLVFLVGVTSDQAYQSALEKESREHRDIVQEDLVDSYRNLSLKSVAMLKWVTTFCNASKYVLKADDDMYINVSNLLAALRRESLSHSTFILGFVFYGVRPVSDKTSKWYTPKELFSEAKYPHFTSGTAYSMTMLAAHKLYAAAAHVPVFWLEDIYITGLCARQAGVPVVNHVGFSYSRHKLEGCYFREAISGHRYRAMDKRTIFKLVGDPNLVCTEYGEKESPLGDTESRLRQDSSNGLGSGRSSSARPTSFRLPSSLLQCFCAKSVLVDLLSASLVGSSQGLAW